MPTTSRRDACAERAGHEGFTLLELLVVIGIIVVLASLSIPVIRSMSDRAKHTQTSARLDQLGLALEQYTGDFGDFPPTSLRAYGLKTNRVNDGIETLLRCLTTEEMSGPYDQPPEIDLINTDNDKVEDNATGSYFATPDAFEMADGWANPIVYWHSRDYDEKKLGKYQTFAGERIECLPGKSEKTGQYQGFGEYQLYSVGGDEKSQRGEPGSDDVVGW